jgi:hypothetical protein
VAERRRHGGDAEVGQLRNQKSELDKLRTENRQLHAARDARVASPSDAAQDYFPKESWSFAGYADPESTLQSTIWAMSKGDLKAMLGGVLPEEAARMEKEFEGKSQTEIAAAVRSDTEMKGFRILTKDAVADDQGRANVDVELGLPGHREHVGLPRVVGRHEVLVHQRKHAQRLHRTMRWRPLWR